MFCYKNFTNRRDKKYFTKSIYNLTSKTWHVLFSQNSFNYNFNNQLVRLRTKLLTKTKDINFICLKFALKFIFLNYNTYKKYWGFAWTLQLFLLGMKKKILDPSSKKNLIWSISKPNQFGSLLTISGVDMVFEWGSM